MGRIKGFKSGKWGGVSRSPAARNMITGANLTPRNAGFPPCIKGGQGGFCFNTFKIPLNPPLEKGDFEGVSVVQSAYN